MKKTIITGVYVCAGLMFAATVLGAINYSANNAKGKYKYLYKDAPIKTEQKPSIKNIEIEDYSRGDIDRDIIKEIPDPKMASKKTNVASKDDAKTKSLKKVAINKKVSYKSFSRAPLRIKEEILVDEIVKVDSL